MLQIELMRFRFRRTYCPRDGLSGGFAKVAVFKIYGEYMEATKAFEDCCRRCEEDTEEAIRVLNQMKNGLGRAVDRIEDGKRLRG